MEGTTAPSSCSIASPDSSIHCCMSSLRIAFIVRPSLRMWEWSHSGSRSVENLLSTSLHVSIKIHTFFLGSWALGLGMALCRPKKSPSYLIRVVGGQRGIHVFLPRYLVCYLRGALRMHPRTK